MEASVTMNDAGSDVWDTEVNSLPTLQLPKLMAKVNEMQNETLLKRRTHNMKGGQESYGIPPNELRLVIIGKSGNGKSSTANTIIGKDICKTGATATRITKETETYRACRFGKDIILVDTPGLFDPEIERKETGEEISRCMYETLPGFHAFLLVVRVGRFTVEEMNTVNEFEKLFGEKLYDFMIIVFTRIDDLFREKKTVDDFVRHSIPPNLKQIIERCNHRYVGMNNIGLPESKIQATKNILEMIETMIGSKDPNHYTNEVFEKAEKDLRERIKAEKERKKAAKKVEFMEMFAEQEKKMREDHFTEIEEMKDVWDKHSKQQEENANRRLEEERESNNANAKAMLENETKAREVLLNQQLKDSERTVKNIMDKNEVQIKAIAEDNAKQERRANEFKDRLDLEKDETEKLRKGIARKEKEMYAKLIAVQEKSNSELEKRLADENKSRQEELDKRTNDRFSELFNNLKKDHDKEIDQLKRKHAEYKQHKEEEAMNEAKRKQTPWFRFCKWIGFF